MEFNKTFEKIIHGDFSTIPLTDCMEFVEYVAEKYNPVAEYKPEHTIVLFQNGFGGQILRTCVSVIEKNPDLFELQVTRLFSKEGLLLSTSVKQF